MPDPVPPPNTDDELVSRVLDGEGTPGDVARVNADPALSARLAEFRAVAAAVGAAPEPAADMRDNAVRAALRALDAPAGDPDPVDAVVPIDSARRRPWRRVAPVAAAAAIVAVALAALPALLDTDHEASTTSAAGATTTVAAADAGAGPTSTAPTVPEATGSGQAGTANDPSAFRLASRAGGDFGSYATQAELADALRQQLALDATTYSAPPAPLGAVATCALDQAAADPALGAAESAGTATVAGKPYTVLVFVSSDGTHRALLVAADSCVPAGTPFAF
jgi:hypothetical protein